MFSTCAPDELRTASVGQRWPSALQWLSAAACVVTILACAGPSWAQRCTPTQVVHPSGAANDGFGISTAISGDTLIVGAPSDGVGADASRGSAHIYRWTASGWTFETTLLASDGAHGDAFGFSVAVSGDTAIIGAVADDVGANVDQGSAYIFVRSGTTWTQQVKLMASDGAANDWLGAAVGISEDTAVVGAYNDNVGANAHQGSAYVFVRSATIWTQQSKLTAADGGVGDFFGYSVAVSCDTALIGAASDDVGGNFDQGSAYVFARSGTTWTQQGKLNASDGASLDQFGVSAALSGDTAVVGAIFADVGANGDWGSAYVFVRSGTTWTQQAKLNASTGDANDQFGSSVALSGDTAIVGVHNHDVGYTPGQGSAYVFVRSGTTWTQEAQLTAADGAAYDEFGGSVAICDDTAAVGVPYDDVGANSDQGSVRVFTRMASKWNGGEVHLLPSDQVGDLAQFGSSIALAAGTLLVGAPYNHVGGNGYQGSVLVYRWRGTSWTLEATLIATDGAAYDWFGSSVALDGDTAVIGAYRAGSFQGSAYVFVRSGTTWTQQAKLVATGSAASDLFGYSVALSGDTAVIGTPGDDVGAISNQGSAFVFVRSGTIWTQQAQLVASDGAAGDGLGISVAVSGNTTIVGANYDDVAANTDQGSAYVFVRAGTTWIQQAQLTASDGSVIDYFGTSIAISGESVLVGAYGDDAGAKADQGAAYVFVRSGTTWTQQARLTEPGGEAGDSLGWSVALSGDTAVLGASRDVVGANAYQGSASVFVRSGLAWAQQAKLTAPNGAASDFFGSAVAVSGNTAVVGVPRDDIGTYSDQGSVWIFSRVASKWVSSDTQLLATDGAANDFFGFSVAVSEDTAVVGAYLDDVGANTNQGSAYIFVRSGPAGAWTLQALLTASDGAASDSFGSSVAISGDTVVVGAFIDDVGANGNQGSAYVFVRSGTTWTQQAHLVAWDGAANDSFGISVAISGDRVLVGAYAKDVVANVNQGSAYVFERSGSTWSYTAEITAADGAANDYFGYSVALSGDTALIGADDRDVGGNTDQGAAYVFIPFGVSWMQQARLVAPDGAANDNFGYSVALSGNTALVGSPYHDVGANGNQGAAYVFSRSGTTWTQQAQLTAADGAPSDYFGYSVALSGDTAGVGASWDDVGAHANQGSAYVFARAGTTWMQQAQLTAPDGAAGDWFGSSVGCSGPTVVVGAYHDNVGAASGQGSAWTFDTTPDCFSVALNESTGTGYPTLAAAVAAASGGNRIVATTRAFAGMTYVNPAGRSLLLRSTGRVRLPYAGVLALDGSSTLESAPGSSIEVHGQLALFGTATIEIKTSDFVLWPPARFGRDAGGTVKLTGGNFDCAINSHLRYALAPATLQLENTGLEQTLEVMSADIGPDAAGLDPNQPGHYPIGALHIGPAASTVRLVDTHDNDGLGQSTREALYVGELRVDAGCRLINTNLRIFYHTLVNNGSVDVPANLVRIPPACPADFNSSGGLEVQDIFDFINAWFSADPRADFNGGGLAVQDIFDFLNAWFAGC